MKKLLISIAIILLVILTGFTLVNGVKIGNFQVFGLSAMKQKNKEIDTKIKEASKLTSADYAKKMSELTSSSKEFAKIKESYQDLTNYSSDLELNQANELPEYDVEFLWAKIGEHATKEGIDIKMDVSNAAIPTSPDGRKLFNLNFTATGSYIGIANFISALENDSALEFKIENFKMIPANNQLQATFVVKDIPIKLDKLSTAPENNTENTNNQNNTTNNQNNTTNTENTTDGGNTTNATNTSTSTGS